MFKNKDKKSEKILKEEKIDCSWVKRRLDPLFSQSISSAWLCHRFMRFYYLYILRW